MAETERSSARRSNDETRKDDDDDEGNDNDEDDDDNRQSGMHRRVDADKLEPDWTYNIGEAILDIQAVTLTSFETGIMVLGERHLFCLKDNCSTMKYAKRLEYKPLCFRAYIIGES